MYNCGLIILFGLESCGGLQRKSTVSDTGGVKECGQFHRGFLCGPYRGVFPVADDLFQVEGGVQQEVLSELVPVHLHGPINIHAEGAQRQLLP